MKDKIKTILAILGLTALVGGVPWVVFTHPSCNQLETPTEPPPSTDEPAVADSTGAP